MDYKSLRIISYNDFNLYEEEYKKRYNSYSTLKTDLNIFPFLNGSRQTDKNYELFYVPLIKHRIIEQEINNNSSHIQNLINLLPSLVKKRLLISQIIEEIKSTNDIEGVKSTRKEIGEAVQLRNSSEKVRFKGIVNMYMNFEDDQFEVIKDISKLREIFDKLFKEDMKKNDLPDGELFRKKVVYVGNDEKIVHQGNPTEASIITDLEKLVTFMNRKDIPFLIKSIITHYFFEYIHPFYDGNGRMGRFIMSSYLTKKIDPFTGISISNAVNHNKKKYSDAFSEVSHPKNKAEVTNFVNIMLELIKEGQEVIIDQLDESLAKLRFAESYIEENKIPQLPARSLFIIMQSSLFGSHTAPVTDKEISKVLGVSRHLLKPAILWLEENDFVIKTGKNPIIHSLKEDVNNLLS